MSTAKKMARAKPQKEGASYRSMWRLVDGAMRDVMLQHPEYFVAGKIADMRRSVCKRVTGTIVGHAEQKSARGRSGENPAA